MPVVIRQVESVRRLFSGVNVKLQALGGLLYEIPKQFRRKSEGSRDQQWFDQP